MDGSTTEAQKFTNHPLRGQKWSWTVAAMKGLRNGSRQRDYAEFYKYYDDKESFERMRDAGLMQFWSI